MNNYSHIIANGCSLTFGAELLGKNNYSLENKNYSWPVILGDKLNSTVENLAVCASSNISIYRSTVDKILNLENTDNTLLIVQWTSLARTEIVLTADIESELVQYKKSADHPVDVESFIREQKYTNLTNGFKTSCTENIENFFWLYQANYEYQTNLLKSYIVSIFSLADAYSLDCVMFNGLEKLNFTVPSKVSKGRYYSPGSFVFYDKTTNNSAHPNKDKHFKMAEILYHWNPF